MSEDALRQACTYLPWIGSRFGSGGLLECSALVLGEAHYTDEGNTNPDLTRNVVERLALNPGKAFFTKTMRIVLGRKERSTDERRAFWDAVGFYNYVQSPVGTNAREAIPTSEQWQSSKAPFFTVVNQLEPDAIVVLGKRLWRHLPEPRETSLLDADGQQVEARTYGSNQALAASVTHPSSGSLAGMMH